MRLRKVDDPVIDPTAKLPHVATHWEDIGALEDLPVARITGK